MRRWTSAALLALALAVGLLVPAGRAAGTELCLTVPEELPRAGETFTVSVDISGNPGFAAVEFVLDYDKATFECTDVRTGTLLSNAMAGANVTDQGDAVVIAVNDSEIQGDGQLGIFSFTVKQTSAIADFRLKEVELLHIDESKIPFTETVNRQPISASPETQRDPAGETPAGEQDPGGTPFPPEPTGEPPVNPPVEPTPLFTDMTGHWAEEDVRRAVDLGILNGYGDGTFRPDAELTRAQFAAILYRQAGSPAVREAAPFADIAGINPEFQAAIAWACGRGLVGGYGDGTFRPQGVLSRQAAMKILFQLGGGAAGAEQMFYGVYDEAFPDSGNLAAWARAPVYWGVYNALIEAGEDGALHPADAMTRARLARAMVRYIDRFEGDETR